MTIEELEKAIAELPPGNLARFRAWFEQFDAARFDEKIERDARDGRPIYSPARRWTTSAAPASYEDIPRAAHSGRPTTSARRRCANSPTRTARR